MPTPNEDPKHLDRLRDYYAKHGVLPSYAGISRIVGFRTKTAAVKLAARLSAIGYLRHGPNGRLAPTELFFSIPLVSAPVSAGKTEAIAETSIAELITLDRFLIDVPSQTVLIRIRGDSMCDAGVLNGDLAIVEQTQTAAPGQFVIAIVDGEFTLKEFGYEKGEPILLAHNSNYEPIRPRSTLEIFGVMRGLVRRYSSLPMKAVRLQSRTQT